MHYLCGLWRGTGTSCLSCYTSAGSPSGYLAHNLEMVLTDTERKPVKAEVLIYKEERKEVRGKKRNPRGQRKDEK